MPDTTSVIIAAAGKGKRFGAEKQNRLLQHLPVFEWGLTAFQKHDEIDEIYLVLRDIFKESEISAKYQKVCAVVKGGESRTDSVRAGFRCLKNQEGIVLVHDGVRPLISSKLISAVIKEAKTHGAVVPAIPVVDTIKRIQDNKVINTEDRSELYQAQTPQGFQYDILKMALEFSEETALSGADEAFLVERTGGLVHVIEGDPMNLKITTPSDLVLAEALLEDNSRYRV